MSKSDFRTSSGPEMVRKGKRAYRLDVAHGLMLLLSPSRSSPVVVSVSAPASDSVRESQREIKIEAATTNRRPLPDTQNKQNNTHACLWTL